MVIRKQLSLEEWGRWCWEESLFQFYLHSSIWPVVQGFWWMEGWNHALLIHTGPEFPIKTVIARIGDEKAELQENFKRNTCFLHYFQSQPRRETLWVRARPYHPLSYVQRDRELKREMGREKENSCYVKWSVHRKAVISYPLCPLWQRVAWWAPAKWVIFLYIFCCCCRSFDFDKNTCRDSHL